MVDTAIGPVVGHGWVLDLLRRSVAAQSRAHAILLTGAPRIGKFTTALALARTLLCDTGDACGACRQCRLASRLVHPDLQVLEVPSDRRTIPIHDVHEFLQGIALRPIEASVRVLIVRGADNLADDGANALLKTLEEPPPAVTMILTAPDTSSLLETMVSRCQVLTLRPVPPGAIAEYLVRVHGLEAGQAELVARASQGRPGWAIDAVKKPALLEERTQQATELLDLVRGGRLERIQIADRVAAKWSGEAALVQETIAVWTDVWRDILLTQHGLDAYVQALDIAGQVRRLADSLPLAASSAALEATLAVRHHLEHNVNPRLALETYALHLPRPAGVASSGPARGR